MERIFTGYEHIKESCISAFEDKKPIISVALGITIMEHPEFPMHYPFHYYLVLAVMITATFRKQGKSMEALTEALEEGCHRAQNVLKGFPVVFMVTVVQQLV